MIMALWLGRCHGCAPHQTALAAPGDGQIEIALRMPDGSQIKGVYRSMGHLFGNHYIVLWTSRYGNYEIMTLKLAHVVYKSCTWLYMSYYVFLNLSQTMCVDTAHCDILSAYVLFWSYLYIFARRIFLFAPYHASWTTPENHGFSQTWSLSAGKFVEGAPASRLVLAALESNWAKETLPWGIYLRKAFPKQAADGNQGEMACWSQWTFGRMSIDGCCAKCYVL